MVMMVIVGLVSLLALILLESNLLDCLKTLTLRALPQKREDLDVDEDVVAEKERLARTQN